MSPKAAPAARESDKDAVAPSSPDSPLWKQYHSLKARYPGAILFFHLGDFYEMFGDDARAAAPVLGLVLTQRQGVPMCGIPAHAAANHVAKLLKSGRRVAIADQVEDPAAAKGLVKRQVTRVLTPGTIVDDALLDPASANHLAAVAVSQGGWGLACADVSTGRFWAAEGTRDAGYRGLGQALAQIQPSEILLTPDAWSHPELKETLPAAVLTAVPAAPPPDFPALKKNPLAALAASALRAYVAENEPLLRLDEPQSRSIAGRLQLDAAAIRTLELVASAEGDAARSLWGALDRCATAMGRRLLKERLLSPLADAAAISARLDRVEALLERPALRESLAEHLSDFPDLERIVTRALTRRTHPKELAALRAALGKTAGLAAWAQGFTPESRDGLEEASRQLAALRRALETSLADDPPVKISDGGVIRPGVSAELDELRAARTDSHKWLSELEARERARAGIPLKVSYNSVFGYYIEVSKTHAAKAPADYVRKQTLANAERYITDELKTLEGKILGAEQSIERLESALFEELRAQVEAQAGPLRRAAARVAALDVDASLAFAAERGDYVRPEIMDGPILEIVEGRHPVVETVLPPGQFVPNDLSLDGDAAQIAILTGPNMAGKSTFLRQNALLVLLAQIGSFVPAKSARVGVVDRIMTRIGARDNLAQGESTFMVEMRETAAILEAATPKSLLVLDEVGRGTSTYDGISIAWAVLEHLQKARDAAGVGPKVLFATHYFELCELEGTLPGVKNLNVQAREWRRPDGHVDVAFLHKIAPGPADRSYGIHVARLAGLPAAALKRAREILERLEREQGRSREARAAAGEQPALPLFSEHPVLAELRELDTDSLTPLAALQRLDELKKRLL